MRNGMDPIIYEDIWVNMYIIPFFFLQLESYNKTKST